MTRSSSWLFVYRYKQRKLLQCNERLYRLESTLTFDLYTGRIYLEHFSNLIKMIDCYRETITAIQYGIKSSTI
jgi:hypothetical protein